MRGRLILISGGILVCLAIALGTLFLIHEDGDVSTEIVIAAPLAQVWRVLGDTARYPEWNPLIREVSGELRTGGQIWVSIALPGTEPSRYQAKLLGVIAEHEIRWEHDLIIPGLFSGKHKLIITAIADGRTKLRHGEEFTGLLVGSLTAGHLARTRDGFMIMNKALKLRVEGGG
ncbi:MAG: SRPBCC domain-containing protein [Alphaproteobacteria bacterium]|nr:SRPBCC domain-containing protein [Alphaproteobacteria bacterium]